MSNSLVQLVTEIDSLGLATSYRHGSSGNLELVDRPDQRTEYEYDALHRRTAEKWYDGVSLVRTIGFEFDAASQLTEASDPAAINVYIHDKLGRVTQEVQTFAGFTDTLTFDYEFNAAGNRTESRWNFGTTEEITTGFVYDDLNRLTQLTRESDEEASFWHRVAFSYNKLGQYTELNRFVGNTMPIGVADTAYSYDDLNRLTGILHTTGLTTWAGYDYTYDAASRILSIDSFLDGLSEYDYDDTDQLVGADHTGSTDETYDYDANGNRDTDYTTGTNNQLESDGIYNYTYDAEGNRATRTKISTNYVTEYTWDHRNRLVAVTEKGDTSNVLSVVENSYDVFNRWIRRSVDSDGAGAAAAVDSFFTYDGNQLALEFAGDDGSDLSHIYSWGPNVDQLIADITHGDTPNFGLTDQLGTPRDFVAYDSGLTDTVDTGHRIYDSFGNLTSQAGTSSLIGFTARPFDDSTGLQNNLNRWYDATVGRWMSEDPIGFAAGTPNLAEYIGNNPLDATDPNGLERRQSTAEATARRVVAPIGNGTYAFGPTGSAEGIIGLDATAQGLWVVNEESPLDWQFGFLLSGNFRFNPFGPGLFGGGACSYTNTTNPDDLNGYSYSVGVSAGEGVGGGVTIGNISDTSINSPTPPLTTTVAGGVIARAPEPVGAYIGWGRTETIAITPRAVITAWTVFSARAGAGAAGCQANMRTRFNQMIRDIVLPGRYTH
ncbi:tRNA(Glu)-specific nuclease WapA precursor [Anatilimnocola aggregata]|uniref:tRNA(Glu)-specific nuclease WapA n=1 Tax=Anatilimnocola aggregata TaxID=2528021 RepID=A0A517YBX2_9BACT|nr:RHS repeat-associated core domain-containing protein [Anatilimnocola aggregata]QDU27747.1 tRNA(Glu)-specific nuclease WapA precursor [Anatilimnocola aggregata]